VQKIWIFGAKNLFGKQKEWISRLEVVLLSANEKSGARASGGAGASCECRAGGNVSWGAKDSSNFYFWRK
jgi:hypothetical protein